jgi:tRNA G18 (ribose-2'-O)-methylase SpoU
MAIVRIAAAAGLLLVLAPEQTMQAAKSMLGMAHSVKEQHMPNAESAMAYCRTNPATCAEIARNAASLQAQGGPSPKPLRP